ncbi:MAG: glycosyltransferase [Coriobacteriia bacterium]|nr:glycosyltransferase [Coriobacteriia bacterium]
MSGAGAAIPLQSLRVCILRTGPLEHDKRTQQVALALESAGAKVTVVCVAPKRRCYVLGGAVNVVEVWPGEASRHATRVLRVTLNLLRHVRQSQLLLRAARRSGAAFYHCMNVDTLLVGFRAARGRPKFAYDSREHFPSMRAPSQWTHRWWLLKERLLVRRAGLLIAVTDMIADDLARRYGVRRPCVVYNGPTDVVATASRVHRPVRLVHVGKLFADRHITEVIDAVAALGGSVVLRLLGWGYEEAVLKRYVRDRELEGLVQFMAPVPPADVVGAISDCDIGVINIKPDTDSHRWTGSNKLFDYMAAGLAELVTDLDFTRRIVESADCGIVMDGSGAPAIEAGLRHLLSDPVRLGEMKANAARAAGRYSWDNQRPVLFHAYAGWLAQPGRYSRRDS